jgi:hypothetical protein
LPLSKTVKSIHGCFPRPASSVWKGSSPSAGIAYIGPARRSIGSRSKTRNIQL